MTQTSENSAPVVIVGGGPVGIGTALELARHGVRTVILEARGPGEYNYARTNLTNLRSMEHFRRWGIADRLRDNDPVSEEFGRGISYVTALNGHVVVDLAQVFAFGTTVPFASDRPEWAPNDAIEKTVHDAAVEHPLIDIRFGCRVTGFQERDEAVHVTYTDPGGAVATVAAPYLVAADGSRSFVRKALGIRMEGVPDLAYCSLWHLRAPDLDTRMAVGKSSFFMFINEFRDNAMLLAQGDDRYEFGFFPKPGEDADDWDRARQVLIRNVGFEFDATPISGGAVMIHSLLAPEFRHGRILLAGDAAHLISPMGGFGMNLGIGDAADLGWKLAAVLQGWGGPTLLDSYARERRPVIAWIQNECLHNTERSAESFTRDGISADTADGAALRTVVGEEISTVKSAEFESFGAQLGTHYHGSPIVVPDGTVPPALSQGVYEPSATPGCRAPHVWLDDQTSLYDRFGAGFTLLVIGEQPIDTSAFETAAKDRGMPLDVLTLPRADLRGLYGAELVLIRPDQYVAWRADSVPTDVDSVLDTVRGAVSPTGQP
ncbi:FAD-dependent monooxygenase [Mycolicibacterium sp.]|uniref:FAD-dependent monooxygenase n=1 Tax=Mycolicibacterium sp. TaxID=2320850 RepID=UPI003D0AFA67